MPEISDPPKRLGADEAPIDFLKPGSDQHNFVLQRLLARIDFSEEKMSKFYSRWQLNEITLQAYISLPDYDALLKSVQDARGSSAVPIAVNVPFAWATVNTIVTYLLHMFGGRNPIFTVGSYRAEQVNRAKNMEMLLQYNADYVRFIRTLYFFLQDGETYGVAAMRTMWRQEKKSKKMIVPATPEETSMMAQFGQIAQGTQSVQSYISFEGNAVSNIDPFMFFPDPRVPMHEVSEKGEFVFWRAFEGRHILMKEQARGNVKYVDKTQNIDLSRRRFSSAASVRAQRSMGDSQPGQDNYGRTNISPNMQVDQGAVNIIPKEWGLGDGDEPEMWMFTILNGRQIIQADPIDSPTGRLPCEVAEPNSVGYSFGQLGTVDMLAPMQNTMSWFMNSHIYNVRASLNNLLVVDPTKVEMKDLEDPEPGGIIRLKNTAFGLSDPKNAIFQLPIMDVTHSHVNDFQLFSRMASDLTGASDNVRGLQDSGGRKTATEIRTSADAGTSRLAAKGKVYSAMAFTGLAEQWAGSYQANMTQEFEVQVLGAEGGQNTVRLSPDNIGGDFFFPVHDGTLPIDKVGLLQVWQQILQGVLADPELRQNFSVVEMFMWICQLGGAQNISSFKVNTVPTGQAQDAVASGQGIPLQQAMAQITGGAGR
jgi:hypothetical protein